MPPSPVFERRSRAALHFPVNIKSAKGLAIFSVDLGVGALGSLCWIALPSSSSLLRWPSFQSVSLLSWLWRFCVASAGAGVEGRWQL